jgi:hypothetical protein
MEGMMAEAAKKRSTKRAPAVAVEPAPEAITSIKGFDQNLQCRGYQFEIGKTFTHEGVIKACEGGFHACTVDAHPLSVFGYYAPAGSRFCEVTQGGETHSDDGIKIASATITIGIELSIGELVKRAWDYVWSRATLSGESHATGDLGAASATGTQGAASATGTQGAASATGDLGAASATGTRGAASATGTRGAASATGYQGAASATGDLGAASATGYQGAASATGTRGAAVSSYEGKVLGADGNALFAIERDANLDIVSVACGIVGRDGVLPNVWYVARGGKLVPSK